MLVCRLVSGVRRRSFLAALTAASVSGTAAAKLDATYSAETVPELAFDSTSSLLNANGEPLTDPSAVPVLAETTATNTDSDGNGDAVSYPDGTDIPLAAVDGSVVGFGSMLVNDDDLDPETGNDEFVLNVWDDLIGGGTVLWDGGHSQFFDLSSFSDFEGFAESNGYDVVETTDVAADLKTADALVVTSPSEAFTDAELDALSSFVADGGRVLLHDQSDYDDFDETANLNAIAESLGLSFRFNNDQVVDNTNNAGQNFIPTTTRFDDSFPYFENRDGVQTGPGLDPSKRYTVDVVSVADGDTFDVEFDDGSTESIRVLGVDSPESASAAFAERPEEWPGLSNANERGEIVETIEIQNAASLLDANGDPLTDDSLVAAWAESTAFTVDEDDDGDAVGYPDDVEIPIAAVDGAVAGFGGTLVADEASGEYDSTKYLLNVWDQLVGPGTVLWDEGHGQFFDLDAFGDFAGAAADAGYDVRATTDLKSDSDGADALVITSPSEAFSDAELDALSAFVEDGGALLLHDQDDFKNYDETTNLNAIAEALDLDFRFNDDQVQDPENNTGAQYNPITSNFNDDPAFALFRSSRGDVPDGEDDYPTLVEYADQATAFAEDELSGKTIEIYFDEGEGVLDNFDRVLAFADYDANGDGSRDTTYNRKLIEEGLARTYASGFERHDDFLDAELGARNADVGIWAESDPENTPETRNRPVDDLFFSDAVAVTSTGGSLEGRAPAAAEDGTPLVGVDESNNVAMVGSPFVDEDYELREDFEVSTAKYENFVFLTNLIETLSDRDGDVYLDGGHGQFAADSALSADDAAYYRRFLEGVDVNFEGVNTDYERRLDDAAAILVTTPASEFTDAQASALSAFAADGGAVILLGSAAAPDDATANLDGLASSLGTDLRLGGAVTDGSSNVNGDETVPVTTNLDDSFDLFDPYVPDEGDDGGDDPVQPTLSVEVDSGRLGDGGTTTATVTVDEAPNGIAGFRLDVGVDDPSVVEVTGGSYPKSFGLVEDPQVADDGSSVTLKASDTDSAIEPGATDVVLATVEMASAGDGTTDLTATVQALDADGGAAIDPIVETGQIEAVPVERIGNNPLPTDPDGDGNYEDLNGNGRVDFQDVVLFFDHKNSSSVTDHTDAYDFNDNGRIDFDDVNLLFEQV